MWKQSQLRIYWQRTPTKDTRVEKKGVQKIWQNLKFLKSSDIADDGGAKYCVGTNMSLINVNIIMMFTLWIGVNVRFMVSVHICGFAALPECSG